MSLNLSFEARGGGGETLSDEPPVFGREPCDDGLELFFDDLLRTPGFSLRERFAYAEYNAEARVERRTRLLCNDRGRFSEEGATFGVTCSMFQRSETPREDLEQARRTEDDVGDPCIDQLGRTGE